MTRFSLTILIAEDNEDDVVLIQEAFSESTMDHRLIVVRDGEEAMAYLRGDGRFHRAPLPNMVMLDINMPKKTGLEVLQEIKSDPQLCPLPVVMLTVSERDEDIVRSFGEGACSYIRKPVTLTKFIEVIREFESYWRLVSMVPTLSR